MTEPDFSSMQTEPLAAGAIQLIANDGVGQSVRVGTVDA